MCCETNLSPYSATNRYFVFVFSGDGVALKALDSCNPQVPGSNPLEPCHLMDMSLVVPNSIPSRFINSQLVSLSQVGILNTFLQFQC